MRFVHNGDCTKGTMSSVQAYGSALHAGKMLKCKMGTISSVQGSV